MLPQVRITQLDHGRISGRIGFARLGVNFQLAIERDVAQAHTLIIRLYQPAPFWQARILALFRGLGWLPAGVTVSGNRLELDLPVLLNTWLLAPVPQEGHSDATRPTAALPQ